MTESWSSARSPRAAAPSGFAALGREDGLGTLLADGARMAPHWAVTPPPGPFDGPEVPYTDGPRSYDGTAPVPVAAIHGIRVPARSARLVEAMLETMPE